MYEPICTTLRKKQEELAATVIQRAYRRRLLRRVLKLASYKYKERTEGLRGDPSPPETEGFLCERMDQLYGKSETLSAASDEDQSIQVEPERDVILHSAPLHSDSNFLRDESLTESMRQPVKEVADFLS